MEKIWNKAKSAVSEKIPCHIYKMWISPLKVSHEEEGKLVLSIPNLIFKKRLDGRYGAILEEEVQRAVGREIGISFQVDSSKNGQGEKKHEFNNTAALAVNQCNLPNFPVNAYSGRILSKDYTFDNFVVGNNNDFAYSLSLSVANQQSGAEDSLFLFSNSGLGKSHLSQAIGHHILRHEPEKQVYYVTADDFANEMVHAFQTSSIDKFKKKYRTKCDVLILEDVHFLTGKERTQIELSHAVDYMREAGKKIVYTSCALPGDLLKINNGLRSRFLSSLISDIKRPDYSTRLRIIEKKAKGLGANIPREVKEYLAGELVDNIRQLESGLRGVVKRSSILGVPVDLALAEAVVKNLSTNIKTITIDTIKKLVCKDFKISGKEIVSKSRKHQILRPRQIAIFLSRRYTKEPLQAIGRSFNIQHTTAIHAINYVEQSIKANRIAKKQVEMLCSKLDHGKF